VKCNENASLLKIIIIRHIQDDWWLSASELSSRGTAVLRILMRLGGLQSAGSTQGRKAPLSPHRP
jgi:hypothetical protein